MTRAELEHAIRAACDVSGDDAVYVFGSQAILGQYPTAPVSLRQSAEADVAPVTMVNMADVIDANLGELSAFHTAHGFYVHGLGIEAAVLPKGWEGRAIRVRNSNTRGKTGVCVEAHDLAASKLVAWRQKDKDFVRILIVEDLIEPRKLLLRISRLSDDERVPPDHRKKLIEWVKGTVKDAGRAA